MDFCLQIAATKPYDNENLNSLLDAVYTQRERLNQLFMAEA
jgi:hypothetical protein